MGTLKLAADNPNALNPRRARALRDLDPAPIEELVRRCTGPDVDWIDLNLGYLSKRHDDPMAFLVETVEAVTDRGHLLDCPHPQTLARGLTAGRPYSVPCPESPTRSTAAFLWP